MENLTVSTRWSLTGVSAETCLARKRTTSCLRAAEHPGNREELKRLLLIEAVKYNVLPLDDRRIERFNSDLAGRPVLVKSDAQMHQEKFDLA